MVLNRGQCALGHSHRQLALVPANSQVSFSIVLAHNFHQLPREEPSRHCTSYDHVLTSQVELAQHKEQEDVVPSRYLHRKTTSLDSQNFQTTILDTRLQQNIFPIMDVTFLVHVQVPCALYPDYEVDPKCEGRSNYGVGLKEMTILISKFKVIVNLGSVKRLRQKRSIFTLVMISRINVLQ